jgi:uncharacterized protein
LNYPTYNPQSPVTPLSAQELEWLDRLLTQLPSDAAMTLDGMDGYLTALHIGSGQALALQATADWLPVVWGGDQADQAESPAPFATRRQRKDTLVLLLRHLRHLAQQLSEAPEAWEPIFSIAEQGAQEWTDARDWCAGFLQAVDLQPQAWRQGLLADWTDPVLQPLLTLGGGLDGQSAAPDSVETCDRLSREVPAAVLLLAQRSAGA